ncbi:unnamed protein product [Parnassius apollo]|uniref:RBR-type E3 ubiquitin transferase n=1 Tax=Parnassius apollo TaxID=110799 RepID=A0A8S3WN78_PARAO|nr:unnamed protein product [Parnassius apollo]
MRRGGGSSGSGGGCGWGGGMLGRWSLRRLLLDSPLVGRRLAHSLLDQGDGRPVKLNTPDQTQTKQTAVQFIAEDEEGEVLECPLCLSTFVAAGMVRLAWCAHRCCEPCLRQYLAIEIYEARVPVNCPVCQENMHPLDVRRIVDNPTLYDKYEEFSVRRALAADPDTRWCPAPDCSFAVVATGCASCPKLTCLAPGCGASFCYHCKAAWHPTQTCDAARRSRQPPPRAPQPQHADMEHGEVKPCPRCSVLIVKVEDGSCNHMVCCVCGAEFCWLCMKEVSDLHYLSPSGCTFWGKKPWSRKKKLLWQLGTLAGAPLGIAVVAGVALPALLVGLPLWAGRRAHRRLRRATPARRRAAVAAAVAAAVSSTQHSQHTAHTAAVGRPLRTPPSAPSPACVPPSLQRSVAHSTRSTQHTLPLWAGRHVHRRLRPHRCLHRAPPASAFAPAVSSSEHSQHIAHTAAVGRPLRTPPPAPP